MTSAELTTEGTPTAVLNTGDALLQVESIYAASMIDRNGRPRKRPFFKALATMKSRMGVPADGMIPHEVFEALGSVAAARGEFPTRRPQAYEQQASGNAAIVAEVAIPDTKRQPASLKATKAYVRQLFHELDREMCIPPVVRLRVACIKALRQQLGLGPAETLPMEVLAVLDQLERQRNALPAAPPVSKPRSGKRRKRPQPGNPPQPAAKPRKQWAAVPFTGRWQELPERSVWTGAPWDHAFAECHWK